MRFEVWRFSLARQRADFSSAVFCSSASSSAFASNAGAEKLVDPNAVAPEYRDAAEKRRAEQLKLSQCSKKADEAKVVRRDRTAYINECLDK